MGKTRDYIYMDVFNGDGKRLGYIKDILLDFGAKKVVGFKVNPYKIIGKDFNVLTKDIIICNTKMVVKDTTREEFLSFSAIKNMYTISNNITILGMVDDIIFQDGTFDLKAIVLKDGTISSIFKERRILPAKNTILGEETLLFFGDMNKFSMVCVPKNSKRLGGQACGSFH